MAFGRASHLSGAESNHKLDHPSKLSWACSIYYCVENFDCFITFWFSWRYLDDDEGIKKYFAAFHLHEIFPAAVIVDDFGDFFHERFLFLSYLSVNRAQLMATSHYILLFR